MQLQKGCAINNCGCKKKFNYCGPGSECEGCTNLFQNNNNISDNSSDSNDNETDDDSFKESEVELETELITDELSQLYHKCILFQLTLYTSTRLLLSYSY